MKSVLILMVILCSKFVNASEDYSNISTTRYVTGGILSIYPGFGIGHAVQGRYTDKGWIFTTGEAISATVAIVGLGQCGITSGITSSNQCSGNSMILAGTVEFLGFKIWEIVDAWIIPKTKNQSSLVNLSGKFVSVAIPSEDGLSVGVKYIF